ncbi:AbiV family abortive infection protein [Roseimarinus sediminis]|uniref:AbiV family abortive infection protein n=1 Tax=Roseimarinus sediminis TaxID=1610899 RepID=UPI003D2508BB
MTPITQLKKNEYRQGALLALENFESLLKISEKAAEINNFGAASSLSVLAMEELSKSVVLQLKSINNLIPIKDLDKYFWNHEIKHNAGLDLYFKLESLEKKDEDAPKSLIVMAIAAIALIIILYNKRKNGEENKKKEKSYFNTIKESGFYVGYDELGRKWVSPQDVHNQESYNDFFELINNFAEKVKNWIFNGKINSDNIIGFIQKLDDNIINKDILDKMK